VALPPRRLFLINMDPRRRPAAVAAAPKVEQAAAASTSAPVVLAIPGLSLQPAGPPAAAPPPSEEDRQARFEQAFALQAKNLNAVVAAQLPAAQAWTAVTSDGVPAGDLGYIGGGADVTVEDEADAITTGYGGQAVRPQSTKYSRFNARRTDAPTDNGASAFAPAAMDDGGLHSGIVAGGGGSLFASLGIPVPPVDSIRPPPEDRHSLFDVDPDMVRARARSVAAAASTSSACCRPPPTHPRPPTLKYPSPHCVQYEHRNWQVPTYDQNDYFNYGETAPASLRATVA
jgi:hypothetical protein